MSRRNWAVCALLAGAVANAGCVTHCPKGTEQAWRHGAEYDVPTACRARVHVFMIHGATPSTDTGLEALRVKLGESGFAKVGTGELYSALWVKSEIDCIRFNDPDARFVLVGYDYGAATAVSLARDLCAKGANVDAVVLLDPLGCGTAPSGVRTLLIASAKGACCAPHTERLVVPDASHFGLPAHPVTVSAVTELLNDIAVQNCQPPLELVPEWTYPHAPEHRPEVRRKLPTEWDFLADRPGGPQPIGTTVVVQPLAPSAAAPVAARK